MSGFSKALLIFLFLLTPLFASQFSPGDLNEAHAHLEGLGNCLKCHEIGQKLSSEKCLSCHTNIKKGRGLHSHSEYQNCITCHKEHMGKNTELIRWEGGREHFDHERTGFRLEGKHRQQSCEKCHQTKQIAGNRTSFLGLSPECLSCHQDHHHKQLSKQCFDCHSMEGWTPVLNFDHDRTNFKLSGKHARLQCSQCHKLVNGKEQFRKISHASCTACHQDKHRGILGTNCEKCHTTESWKTLSGKSVFNHDLTHYPLRGKHISVKCQLCHKKEDQNHTLVFDKCEACHKNTHKGYVNQNPCESRHSVSQFSPSGYTVARHNQETHFKLKGSHLAVSCQACHFRPPSKQWDFRANETTCINCHTNKHKGYFRAMNEEKKCEECHDDRSWAPSKFDHDRDSRYALDGAHRKLACRVCHQNGGYRSLPLTCQGCHTNAK